MSSSGAGESSNSLNDRTAVRLDAAIQAAMAIAGTSSNFVVAARPTGRFNSAGGGGGGGEERRNDTSCQDLAIRPAGGSGGPLPSGGGGASTKSAMVTRESSKATTEARLDAAIRAALVIHATDSSSSASSSSTLQGSIRGGGYGTSLALTAPPRGGSGESGGTLTVYEPPAPPRSHRSASRESSTSGYYGDTSGGGGGGGGAGYTSVNDARPAYVRARENRSGIGVSAGVNHAVQALASARKSEAHQANAAATRLQRLKDEQRSRRSRQSGHGSSGERPCRPRESEAAAAAALEQRKDYPRRTADAIAGGQTMARAGKRTMAETLSRERVFQDELPFAEGYGAPPPAAKAGQQAANYGSRAVSTNTSRPAMRGTAERNAAFVPTVAGDRFLPETSTRRARVDGARESQPQPWGNGDNIARWNW